jgi:prophage regulatory protein
VRSDRYFNGVVPCAFLLRVSHDAENQRYRNMTHRTNPHPIPHALLTVKDVLQTRGVRTSKHYDDIKGGLYTPPVKQGRSSVWPINEVDALNRAVIAGKSDDEIRVLVAELMAARTTQGMTARSAEVA